MQQLVKKLLWTIFILIVFECGNKILLPGFSPKEYSDVLNQNAFLNLLSSSFGIKMTVPVLFSLGMGPYMAALIVWQVVTMLNDQAFKNLTQVKIGVYQKLITLTFATFQGITLGLLFMKYKPNNNLYGIFGIYIGTVIAIITGSMFVSWLADINAQKGLGGTSILILPGIINSIPSLLNSGLKKPIVLTPELSGFIVFIVIVFIYSSVFMNKSEIRISIERINVDSNLSESYVPLKILSAGAMPFMFALTLYSIPILIISQFKIKNSTYHIITTLFSYHNPFGIVMYGIVILLLNYGFSFVNVRTHEISKSLQRSGDYIIGIAAGNETEKYINKKLRFVISIGSLYVLGIIVSPLIIGLWIPEATNFSFLFGSLLIVITMLDNVIQESKALILKKQYRIFI